MCNRGTEIKCKLEILDNIIIVMIIIVIFELLLLLLFFTADTFDSIRAVFYSNAINLLEKNTPNFYFYHPLNVICSLPFLFFTACITCLCLNYNLVCSLYPFLILNQIKGIL